MACYNKCMVKSVFFTNFFEQKKTVESLLKESQPNTSFYLFLSVSAFITTLGLMTGNIVVIIGGMLVAPLLFPILSLGMGIATSSSRAMIRATKVIIKSLLTVSIVSFVTAFILNAKEITEPMILASTPDILFFLTAFASGIIAAYAWVKKNIESSLPGVAVTVSLIPPLALIGISVSFFSRDLFSGSVTLFLINLLGIVLASTIVFSLFGFSRLQEIEEERIKEEDLSEKVREEARKVAQEEEDSKETEELKNKIH